MQFTMKSFRQLFPDKIFFPVNSLIFNKIPDISLIAVKFPDISRFSRQVVTLRIELFELGYCESNDRRERPLADCY